MRPANRQTAPKFAIILSWDKPESVKSTFIIGQQKREQFLQLKKAAKMFSSGQIFSFNPVQGAETPPPAGAASKIGLC